MPKHLAYSAVAKRFVWSIIVVFMLLVLATSVVLAYAYRAAYTITNNSTTAYSMLPVSVSVNNTYLAANGFIGSTGIDTRVETLGGLYKPWMITDNSTFTAVAVPASSQTNLYYTAGSSNATAFDIITGYGGNVTISDNSTLELGNNFTIMYSGYFDTVSNTYSVTKSGSFTNYLSGSSIQSRLEFIGENLTATDDTSTLYSNVAARRIAQTFTPEASGYVLSVGVRIHTAGTVTTAEIQSTNATFVPNGTVLGSGTFDSSGLGVSPGSFQTIQMSSPVAVTAGTLYGLVLRDATPGPNWRYDATAAAYTRGELYWSNDSGGTWTAFGANQDGMFQINMARIVTAYRVPGSYAVVVSANTTVFSIAVDGAAANTTSITDGVKATDNANSWYLMQNNSMAWMDYYRHYINGRLVAWYQPVAMIQGTALPNTLGDVNLDGALTAADWVMVEDMILDITGYTAEQIIKADVNNDGVLSLSDVVVIDSWVTTMSSAPYPGTFSWGANPVSGSSGVYTTLGGFVSSSQPAPGSTTTVPTRDIIPVGGGVDPFLDPSISPQLQTNPLRPLIQMVSDNTTFTERQVWTYSGLAMVLLVLMLVATRVRGHHLITGVAVAVIMLALIVLTVFPLWTLTFVALSIFAGIISERTKSM